MNEATLTEHGIVGDRMWAIRELDRGGIMSARTWPAMLRLGASYQGDPAADSATRARLEFPDRQLNVDDPAASALLSDFFRRDVRLERIRRERLTEEEIEAITRGDAYPPRRDFFDEDVIHVIASGTLEHLRGLCPGSDFDRRRFRANIYVDTGAEADGFIEDRWLSGVLEIGQNVRISGLRPAIRCAMTTHPQSGLPHDVAILRTAWQHHQAYVGIFAAVGAPGRIRVGDKVALLTRDADAA